MKKLKIGVIGLGARAETFVRQLAENKSPRAELFGVCDIDTDRMKKFNQYCNTEHVTTYSDPVKFMNEPEMDAVIITTPDFAHLEVAKLAFAANKHTYLEKPLEVTAEKCREIIRESTKSTGIAFVGFNLRASASIQKMKDLVDNGAIGQVVHIEGLEQLSQSHSASFMRRFHRKKAQSGGLLNTKCSHDLDILQWFIGHQHKVAKVASFGGVSIFSPQKAPAKYCHECPYQIYSKCPYKDKAGFVFPVTGDSPIHKTVDLDIYGGDLCVYNTEKELIDNQTIILEWDNGVRGNFNLQLFQNKGLRKTTIWGEKGMIERAPGGSNILLTNSDTGDTSGYDFAPRSGGHGGVDPLMLGRFIDAIQTNDSGDSGLAAGLAATLLAEKANQAMENNTVITVHSDEYNA